MISPCVLSWIKEDFFKRIFFKKGGFEDSVYLGHFGIRSHHNIFDKLKKYIQFLISHLAITMHMMLSIYEVLWIFYNLVLENKEIENNSKSLIKNKLKTKNTRVYPCPIGTHLLNFGWIITKNSFPQTLFSSLSISSSSQSLPKLPCLNFTN